MTARRLERPSGFSPPTEAFVGDDAPLDLVMLAREICRRYQQEFPDERERYGDAGTSWCVHDNQHLLNWAAGEVRGVIDMKPEVVWLARILEARDFPLARLARNLQIGAEVVVDQPGGPVGDRLATVLREAAAFVMAQDTFLEV